MQEGKYSIKDWAKNDQPREKLLRFGAERLSDTELIAILIQSGTRGQSAVELARQVLHQGKNNLQQLGRLPVKSLMKLSGIGSARAVTIAAALELGRRRHAGNALEVNTIYSSKDVAHYLQTHLKDHTQEVFAILFLNQANRINHFEIISQGGITGTIADPRVILKKALEQDAVSIILCHNHPSGSLRPSRADLHLTQKLKAAANLFDIKITDHVIVGKDGWYSFADEGLL